MTAVTAIRPAPVLTLADLASVLIAADDRLRSLPDEDTAEYSAADDAFLDARDAFRGALEAQTGLSREMFDRLGAIL